MTNKSYFDGAKMAYEDAAQFIEHLGRNLPTEIKFIEPSFTEIVTGLRNKIKNLDLFLTEGTEQ